MQQKHARTGAAVTTTKLTPAPRPGLTSAQISAQQRADVGHQKQQVVPAAAPPPPAVPAGPISAEAFERNLANWGSGSGMPLVFNGLDGKYQSTGGEAADVEGVVFIAHLDETRKDWLRFNGEGNQPTLISVGIMEDAALPSREELGDMDQSLWEIDKIRGEPVDPWMEQIRVPLVSANADGTVYELTSRSRTALYAIRGLIERYGRHPQRKKGLVPLVLLEVGTYFNRNLDVDKPKPVYRIVGWVQKDGSASDIKLNLVSTGGPSDEIPF
jgi:hypothetical protein